MKPFYCIAIFIATTFCADRLIATLAHKALLRSKNVYMQMYNGAHPAQIVILGDSRADRNVNSGLLEARTGKTCVNLGLGGNNVVMSEALLHDFIDRYGNPDLVMIEVSHSTVEPESLGEMRILSSLSPRIAELAAKANPRLAFFSSIFHSLRFNEPTLLRIIADSFVELPSRLLTKTIPPATKDKWSKGDIKVERPVYDENMQALSRICRYSKSHEIPVRLLISPTWPNFRKAIVNLDEWKSELRKACLPYEIEDLSEAFDDHASLFNDTIHLNAEGADRLLQILFPTDNSDRP